MVKDVIEGIKETEAKAAGMIEEARKKRVEIVAGAREGARKAIEEAQQRGSEQVKQALEGARKDAEAKIEGIAAAEKAECEKVRQSSARSISKAVETVIERVLE